MGQVNRQDANEAGLLEQKIADSLRPVLVPADDDSSESEGFRPASRDHY
jgi:hypothetical protein